MCVCTREREWCSHMLYHVHKPGVQMHIFARCEVSMIKAVTGTAVHRWYWCQQQHHMTDRAWLHRLITKWAKNLEQTTTDKKFNCRRNVHFRWCHTTLEYKKLLNISLLFWTNFYIDNLTHRLLFEPTSPTSIRCLFDMFSVQRWWSHISTSYCTVRSTHWLGLFLKRNKDATINISSTFYQTFHHHKTNYLHFG